MNVFSPESRGCGGPLLIPAVFATQVARAETHTHTHNTQIVPNNNNLHIIYIIIYNDDACN